MQQKSRVVFGLFVVTSLAVLVAGAKPDATKAPPLAVVDDPVAWAPPAQAPELHERLKGGEYRARFEIYQHIAPNDAARGGPFSGAIINDITPDSQAEDVGLQPRDVIVSIDGNPMRTVADVTAIRALAGDDQLAKVWSDADQKYRLINLKPGLIGIAYNSLLRPELMYLQSLPVGEKPSQELLVAALALEKDKDLAETALWHASQNGETSFMLDWLAANVTYAGGKAEDALAFCDRAAKKMPGEERWTLATVQRSAAIASFHLKLAMDMDDRYKFLAPDHDSPDFNIVQSTYNQFKALPVDRMANPIEEFEKLHFHDFSRGITVESPPDFYAKAFNDHGSSAFLDDGSDPSLSNNALLGPFGANVDFSATVHFKPSNDRVTQNPKAITFSFATPKAESKLIRLSVRSDGYTQIEGEPPIPVCRYDLKSQVENDKSFKVHMAAVGDRMEVVVNGARLYYGPLLAPESSRKMCVFMMMTASSGEVSDYIWRTAGARGEIFGPTKN